MTDDLHRLVVDLEQSAARADVDARKLLQVAAFEAKADWQRRWSGIRGLQHLAAAVTYDLSAMPTGASVEIGPDPSRKQGPLDTIVEYGTSTLPPIRPVAGVVLETAAQRLASYLGSIEPL